MSVEMSKSNNVNLNLATSSDTMLNVYKNVGMVGPAEGLTIFF